MRFGPKKQAGVVVLVLWGVTSVLLLAFVGDSAVVLLTAIGVGVVAAVAGQGLVAHYREQRQHNQMLGRIQSIERDLRSGKDQVVRDVAKELRGAAQGVVKELRRAEEGIGKELRRTEEGFSEDLRQASESVAQLRDREGALVEGVQSLRSDVEWLEEILAGVGKNLSALRERSAVMGPRQSDELRVLAATPVSVIGNHSSRRINALLKHHEQSKTRYLEIGLEAGKTFEAVQASHRVGVEPVPRFGPSNLPADMTVLVCTSDRFFELLTPEERFHVVYVDGLHVFQQIYLDVMNTLDHLEERGVVVIDDVIPTDEVSAIPNLTRSLDERQHRGLKGAPWHGDVFKLIPVLRDHYPQLEYRTIVGSGNEQTILWWPDRSVSLSRLDSTTLASYADMAYGEVFKDGIPHYFSPVSEDDALADATR